MWSKTFVCAAITLVAAGSSMAQECPCGSGTLVSDPAAIANLLGGRTVCAAIGTETWQEFHSGATVAGGPLIDWKRGPGDAVDPQKQVGTWSVTPSARAKFRVLIRGTSVVTYDYGKGGAFSYAVCTSGSQVNFCGDRNVLGATLINGQAACGPTLRASQKKL